MVQDISLVTLYPIHFYLRNLKTPQRTFLWVIMWRTLPSRNQAITPKLLIINPGPRQCINYNRINLPVGQAKPWEYYLNTEERGFSEFKRYRHISEFSPEEKGNQGDGILSPSPTNLTSWPRTEEGSPQAPSR